MSRPDWIVLGVIVVTVAWAICVYKLVAIARRRRRVTVLVEIKYSNADARFTGDNAFIVVDGVRVAQRKNQAWVALVPGWDVEMSPDYETVTVKGHKSG